MSNVDAKSQSPRPETNEVGNNEPSLQRIREALRGLRYGSVNVIVQDGVVIQIDRLEKFRLRNPGE
ncbi:MAG: YezD family protein [Planctomycetota bacterium]|nr:YezD family protein [Planctomycetota bacterium]